MTISSGNLQTLLIPPSPGPELEGRIAPSVSGVETGLAETAEMLMPRGEFYQMLSQSLRQDEIQIAFENNDLSDLPENISNLLPGLDPELAGEPTSKLALPADWLQVLKSHFSVDDQGMQHNDTEQPDVALPIAVEPTAEAVEADPAPTLLFAALPTSGGEVLPLPRQVTASIEPPVMPIIAELERKVVTAEDGMSMDFSARQAVTQESPVNAAPANQGQMLNLNEPGADEGELNDMLATQKNESSQIVADRTVRQPVIDIQPLAVRASEPASTTFATVALAAQAPSVAVPSATVAPVVPNELQTLQLPNMVNATQWGDALGERVALLINHKLSQAEIRLDPPHLGKLDIQIQVKDDNAVIHIQAHQAQTRDMIDSAGQRLREVLQEAGYNAVDVNVSQREQSAQGEAGTDGGSGFGVYDEAADQSEEKNMAQEVMLAQGYQTSRGLIDYFA